MLKIVVICLLGGVGWLYGDSVTGVVYYMAEEAGSCRPVLGSVHDLLLVCCDCGLGVLGVYVCLCGCISWG